MSEISAFLGTYLGAVILFTAIGLLLKWLFIRSAVRSGVEAALTHIINNTEYIEEITEEKKRKEFEEEMKNW